MSRVDMVQDPLASTLIAETDIAIVGMAGRFPKAADIEAYWDNLQAGRECIKVFSDEELQNAGVPTYLLRQPNYVKATGVLEDHDCFDASFFGFSPKEAQVIDPQHRLFLEQAWTVLEQAGYNANAYGGAIGVYVGVGLNTYLLQSIYPNLLTSNDLDTYQVQIRNDKDFLPTLVSYKLNLRGPSLSIQTACSTSLVAVHTACQALINGECDMAIAGGVTVFANPTGYLYTEGMILSPDGHCRAFDAKAQGTVGGNGVGAVLLKRLELAIADGDTIHAVIKGSAINNDGAAKVGYTAPSVTGQAAVITEAQAIAGTPADTITYVETHGTGTSLGDPIEIAALTQAFRHTTEAQQFCAIGSVKTNIGHLDTAAGVASLIKVTLALKHRLIPPSLNFETPNPAIPFHQSPFFVNTQLRPWTSPNSPRRAGVSSFGIGGTNAHVIVEEAPEWVVQERTHRSTSKQPWHLLVLSAKSQTALQQQQQNLARHLKQHPESNLRDVAYTLAQGRQAFSHRWAMVVQTGAEAIAALEQASPELMVRLQNDDRPPLVFCFPGQGAQAIEITRELYAQERVFRETMDSCAEILLPLLNRDIRQLLYPTTLETQSHPPVDIQETQWAQPILFAVEYALAQLWLSWGIQPDAMIGHSLGEYVAACLAGVFSLQDGLWLVAHRAKLMQQLPPGAMLVVPGTEAEVTPWLNEHLALAAANGGVCTVSGTIAAIEQLEASLTTAGISPTRLKTSHAFHSPLVEGMIDPFRQLLRRIVWHPPELAYLSNVTGTWITAEEATDPEYWICHLRQTVRFGAAIAQVLPDPNWIFLEVAPGRTLTALIRRHPNYKNAQVLLNTLPTTGTPAEPETKAVRQTLSQLWLRGVMPKWKRFFADELCYRLPLPTYPFERQRHWMSPPEGSPAIASFGLSRNPDLSRWYYAPTWQQLPSLAPELPAFGQCWLILLDEVGLGKALAQRLNQLGQQVITVAYGDRRWFQAADFFIKPEDPQALFNLLTSLKAQQRFPHHIVHLWSLEQSNTLNAKTIATQTEKGLYSLLTLAQAIGKVGQPHPLHLSVIGQGTYALLGTESINPVNRMLVGAVKVIPQEYSQITCRYVDLVAQEVLSEKSASDAIDSLLTELGLPDAPLEMAYRGRSRWMPVYQPVTLPEPEAPIQLRPRGLYLITGGLGGIGLTLARYLAETVQARLLLVTRSPLPPRQEWYQWCQTQPEDDPTRRKIQQVLELEQLGAQVWLGYVDITDLDAMDRLISRVESEFGSVRGVLHCAGVSDFGGIIQSRDRSATERILAAKVSGTLVLEQIFRDYALDFWFMSSSLSTVLYKTLFGQVGYAAANEFLNGFCEYKRHHDRTVAVAVQWTEWSDVGMAVDARAERLKIKARAEDDQDWLVPLRPTEGATAFARVLTQPHANIAVCAQDLTLLLRQQSEWQADQWLESLELEIDTESPKQPRPELSTDYVPATSQLEAQLIQQWEAYLGIAPIGLDDSFYDLGGDSLLAFGLLAHLQKQLNTTIPITILLESPTVAGLSTYLQTQAPEAVAQWLVPVVNASSEVPEASTVSPSEVQSQMLPIPPLPSPISQSSDPVLFPLRLGSDPQKTLFLMHPIGGGVSCYTLLTRYLLPDWSIYGVRAVGLEGEALPINNLEQMAALYLQTICKQQPSGSYYLGGWSMGGTIAYEMTRQAIQQGKTVSGLILVDSPAPIATSRDPMSDFMVFAQGLGFDAQQAEALSQTLHTAPTSINPALQQLLHQGQHLGLLPNVLNLDYIQQLYTVFNAHSQALSDYTAQPLPSATVPPTLLLQAKTGTWLGLNGTDADDRSAWKNLLERLLMIRSVPGDHFSIVTEPHVAQLALSINAFLGHPSVLTRLS